MSLQPANPPVLVRWQFIDRFGGWRKMKWGMVHLVGVGHMGDPDRTVCGKVINEQERKEERYAPSAERLTLQCRSCKKAVGYDLST